VCWAHCRYRDKKISFCRPSLQKVPLLEVLSEYMERTTSLRIDTQQGWNNREPLYRNYHP